MTKRKQQKSTGQKAASSGQFRVAFTRAQLQRNTFVRSQSGARRRGR